MRSSAGSCRDLRAFRSVFVLLAWALVAVGAASAQPPPQPPGRGRPLFDAPSTPADAGPATRVDPVTKRGRLVRANADVLLLAGGTEVVTLNLFDDVQLRARRQQPLAATPAGGIVWIGQLLDRPGQAVIATRDGVMAGGVFAGDQVFEILYAGGGLHEIRELDPAAFPTDDPAATLAPIEPDLQPGASDAEVAAGLAGDSAAQVDVMVIWTPAARAAAGGASAMRSLVDLSVAATNVAYGNSAVTQRIRLVYAGELAYVEAGSSSDLTRLAGQSDGYLDAVHGLRNTYGADVVTLIGEGYVGAGICGLGYLMSVPSTSFASSAFNLVDRVCTGANLTYAHELGHNMGLHHDPANAIGSPAYSYAYGYQHPAGAFRTVMAYQCPSGSCPRVMHFSNPSVAYSGMATGTASQNNALALNNTAPSVANFRQAAGGGCTYALGAPGTSIGSGGGPATISVIASAGCGWTATSQTAWITVTGGAAGTGNGLVSLGVAANSGSTSRVGTVTAAGQTFTVTQAAACTVGVSPATHAFGRNGGTSTVSVSATPGCSWTAGRDVSWIAISGPASGTGNGTVMFTVAANTSTASRTGHVVVGSAVATATQLGRARTQALDFDLDGLGDLFLFDASGAWRRESGHAGGFSLRATGTWGTGWQVWPADFNADDRSDLFAYNAATGAFQRLITQADGTFVTVSGTWSAGWSVVLLDLTGDGRSDVFLHNSQTGQWFQCLTQPGLDAFYYRTGWWAPGWTVSRAVLNVDGRDDLFLYNARSAAADGNSGRWFRVFTQADGSFRYVEGDQRWIAGWTVTPADFTGDGVSEVLLSRTDGLWFRAAFGTSGTTYQSGNWTPGLVPQRAEFNGDGRADVFLYNPATGQWATAITPAGGGFLLTSGTWLAGWQTAVTDLNGDGRSDVLLYHPEQGLWGKVTTIAPGSFGYVIGSVGAGWTLVGGHVVLP